MKGALKILIKKACGFKYKGIIACVILSVIFLLAGIFYRYEANFETVEFFYLPFSAVGNFIRSISDTKLGELFGYAVYIVVCLSPFIFFIVKTAIKKRLVKRDILSFALWAGLSVFLFFAVYYFINPHRIGIFIDFFYSEEEIIDLARPALVSMIKFGYAVTFYMILTAALIFELSAPCYKNKDKAYVYSKFLILFFATAILFNALFIETIGLRYGISQIKASSLYERWASFNITVTILIYIVNLAPSAFLIGLLFKAYDITARLQKNMLNPDNVVEFKILGRRAAAAVATVMLAAIFENLIYLMYSDRLLYTNFTFAIPAAMLFIACAIAVISKLLIKAVELNEENKLVI
ncbi:MAG: DUF2975 domain-containing protein [Clostridiales bacterium]|nr:DUF2975 domain-containing protein [Clostridiales bacterium]